ncbi:MAG: DUF2231 domain-containing protein [Armatimonadetes bacterium]|nr:DUF2231 domain-containing protein [Armatimonadota bacterium]
MSIHPVTVHFPIALLVVSFIFDLLGVVTKDESFRKAGFYCLILALFGLVASYFTGLQAQSAARSIPNIEPHIRTHMQAGVLTLVLTGVLVIGRIVVDARPAIRRAGSTVYLGFLLIAVISVLRAGYLGSELVQQFGAGVEPIMKQHIKRAPSSGEKPGNAHER